MKFTFFTLLSLFSLSVQAQHSMEKVWESDTTLAVPESVLPDARNKVLYVSLIDGAPWGADGRGGIAKLDLNGKIIDTNWITGLHAPKGMGLHGNKLYVADLNEVVVIDVPKNKIDNRIKIEGAEYLNDITVDNKGAVFVSDSKHGTIYRIDKGSPVLYMKDFKGVNGLRAVGDDLYILTSKEVYRADKNKQLQKISEMELGGDGIEPVGNGDFIASSWIGQIRYINKDGSTEVLLDTREQKSNTADIGYDAKSRMVYVPTFFKKSVVAYRLK